MAASGGDQQSEGRGKPGNGEGHSKEGQQEGNRKFRGRLAEVAILQGY